MSFRKYFTCFILVLVFFSISSFGKFDHPVVRITLLIFVPLLTWFLIGFISKFVKVSLKAEVLLNKILSGIISFIFLVLAVSEYFKTSHIATTKTIRTNQGLEDVGDYISITGPNFGSIILCLVFSYLFFWFGVINSDKNK